MPKFDKKYVHFMWSDELKGKVCVLEDYIGELQQRVEQHDEQYIHTVIDKYNANYPFYTQGREHFSFCYYDPYYEFKIALEQGKTIQGKTILTGEWVDMAGKNIDWDNVDGYELRIKPEVKPVTNRELARWLAKGNGECKQLNGGTCIWTDFHYWIGEENTPAEYLIRKWEDEKWCIPTREYLGLE